MKELAIWAAVIATAALLVACGVPFAAVGGTFTLLCVIGFVAIEFWNITRWFAKLSARLSDAPAPDAVDRVMGIMDKSEREYAGTRNASQERRKHG